MSSASPQGDSPFDASRSRKVGARFPRSSRLLRHADFERVYKEGRRHFSSHMTVFYLRRANGEGLRVGLTVGRALGGAVQRNRIKRRLREAVRGWTWIPMGPVDIVINPKKSASHVNFLELTGEVGKNFAIIAQKLTGKTGK